jgi:glycosyltransferase involved in cell wall biosynthesis
MKVLWFTNTPCLASNKLAPDLVLGGWLKSLEEKMVDNIDLELSICFYWYAQIPSFKYGKTQYYPIYRNNGSSKIKKHILKYFYKSKDTKEIPQLLKVVAQVKPDIIHIHGTEDNFGLIQSLIDIPCIISIQGLLAPISLKYYDGIKQSIVNTYITIYRLLKHQPFLISYKGIKKRALREKKILSEAKYIIGRTSWDRRITQLLAPKSSYYVGNEILRPVFYTKVWNKNEFNDTIEIITVSNSSLYKGFETIVQTAKMLKDNGIINFKWTVIGINEHTPIVQITKRWLNVDFKELNISLIGSKNEEEVSELLINSDIYCQCSHIENSPNSLCEAMLLGMPIVASFAGGTDSMLENKMEGILVQTGDYYSFAGAIKEMINNPEQSLIMGRNARLRALERHNANKIIEDLFHVYKNLI